MGLLMTALLSVIITFLLTAVLGNRLLYNWQHRNWIRQQQFLGQEKEYLELRNLFPELTRVVAGRIYRAQRLYWAVNSLDDKIIEERLKSYDESIVEWNININSYYSRLTVFARFDFAKTLETEIHEPLRTVGDRLEAAVRRKRLKSEISRAELNSVRRDLNKIVIANARFTKLILRYVDQRRETIYFGKKIVFSERNLVKFSNWELIKALFVPDIESHSVTRSSADSTFP
jgi:hypothetical protein